MALITDYHVLSAFEFEMSLSYDKFIAKEQEIVSWLVENFGYDEDNGLWDMWEWPSRNVVYFTFVREEDAAAFKLAWS